MRHKPEIGGAGGRHEKGPVEWPTVALTAAIYVGFGLLTWHYDALPWWTVLPLGAYLVCLHGSLQHEAVHGHPTPWIWLNEALVFPSLWLWMPYRVYRDSHLRHHTNDRLTDPLSDPESYYMTPDAWARTGALGRLLGWSVNTLLGRLVLGPSVCVWRCLHSAVVNLIRGDEDSSHSAKAWLLHGASLVLVLAWVMGVCEIPLAAYIALFAYPGVSLTLLRSFLEHQAREEVGERSVVVEAEAPLALMFLNNNLHALHHAEPGLAWYRLPARYRQRRAELLAENGGYLFHGYLEVFRRYFLRAKESPAHPCFHTPTFARLRVANDPGQPPADNRVA
jgi:fatty acid desaturase